MVVTRASSCFSRCPCYSAPPPPVTPKFANPMYSYRKRPAPCHGLDVIMGHQRRVERAAGTSTSHSKRRSGLCSDSCLRGKPYCWDHIARTQLRGHAGYVTTSAGKAAEVFQMSAASPSAGVAVAQVRRLFRRELVLLLQLSQPVRGIGRHRRGIGRLQVEAIKARGVHSVSTDE